MKLNGQSRIDTLWPQFIHNFSISPDARPLVPREPVDVERKGLWKSFNIEGFSRQARDAFCIMRR